MLKCLKDFDFSRASNPPCGIENGLWLNAILSCSSHSNIGKSIIQQNWKTSLSINPLIFLPSFILICPASSVALFSLSAIKKIVSFCVNRLK